MWRIVRNAAHQLMSFNAVPIVTHGKRDTVVTLLGWAGAADKNVAKYADIYQKKGYTTVQFTAVPQPKGWGTRDGREVSLLARSIDDVLINRSTRLVFHLFSMNGFLALTSLDVQYPELKVLEKCDGLFLDSCPASFSEPSIDNLYAHALVMDHVYNGIIKEKNFLTSNFYRVFKKYETAKFGYRLFMDDLMVRTGYCKLEEASPYHYLVNHPNLPHVITTVFSDADVVCSADDIAAFNDLAMARTDKKRDIISIRLKDSVHVEHYRKYPKLYLEKMYEWLERVEKYQKCGGVTAKI